MKVGTGSFFFVRMSNWLRPKHAAADLIECVRFAKDSPLEGDGFELTVSRRERNEPPSGSRHGGDKSPSPSGSLSSGYQWFESISLQRRVVQTIGSAWKTFSERDSEFESGFLQRRVCLDLAVVVDARQLRLRLRPADCGQSPVGPTSCAASPIIRPRNCVSCSPGIGSIATPLPSHREHHPSRPWPNGYSWTAPRRHRRSADQQGGECRHCRVQRPGFSLRSI